MIDQRFSIFLIILKSYTAITAWKQTEHFATTNRRRIILGTKLLSFTLIKYSGK